MTASELAGSPKRPYKLTEQDMEINPEQLEHIKAIYAQYELHSRTYKEQQEIKNHERDDLDIFMALTAVLTANSYVYVKMDTHRPLFQKEQVDLVFMKIIPTKAREKRISTDFRMPY